ncbi:MAG: RNA methyltransferase [Endomicrobiales bacterium]|nr:RNA methyltransferase [Endomicrobiales bacterium]
MDKITSKSNEKIKRLKKLISDRDFRRKCGKFAVEGVRALDGLPRADELFVREGVKTPGIPAGGVTVLDKKVFDAVSSTENSQGVIAVAPLVINGFKTVSKDGRYLLLDGISDPGNMGTIIRTACAFDIRGVILGPGCVDPFSPKAARASGGGLWGVEVIELKNPEELSGHKVVGADIKGTPIYEFEWPPSFILAVGSEARGLSPDILKTLTGRVRIPISKRMESLNASIAAGILLFDASLQVNKSPGR